MLMNLLFFVAAGATLSLLLWSGAEIFRAQEDPLGDRLEELQSQALVAAQRTARRKIGGTGLDRILSLVGMVPGGDDWMRGSDRLLRRATTCGRFPSRRLSTSWEGGCGNCGRTRGAGRNRGPSYCGASIKASLPFWATLSVGSGCCAGCRNGSSRRT